MAHEEGSQESLERILSREEAISYIESQLGVIGPIEALRTDPIEFVDQLCRRFVNVVPFQSVSILVTERCNRFLPNMAEIKRDIFSRVGGCCYTLNVFMCELLRALGLSVYYARCAIHGVEDCHVTVIVRDLVQQGDRWMVDVGSGYILTRPVCLTFPGFESPVHKHGFLEVKFVSNLESSEPSADVDDLTIWRLHSDSSTFEAHEKTLNRPDGFNHVFWKMSLRPRPLHDRGETEQYRAFVSFHKLRCAIGEGPTCRLVYFKADNDHGRLDARVLVDENGRVEGTRLNSLQLLERLIISCPTFGIRTLADAIDRLCCTTDFDGTRIARKLVSVVDEAPFSLIRVRNGLQTLYPHADTDHLLAKVRQRLDGWRSRVQDGLKAASVSSDSGLCEKDVVLIAYPDHLKSASRSPLSTLSRWCSQNLKNLVSTVHVLVRPSPAFP